MTWQDAVRHELRRYARENDSNELTLQRFYDFAESRLQEEYPNNDHVRAKIRQVLQQLRDQNEIEFVDNDGRYGLNDDCERDTTQSGIEILDQLESEFENV